MNVEIKSGELESEAWFYGTKLTMTYSRDDDTITIEVSLQEELGTIGMSVEQFIELLPIALRKRIKPLL